MQLIKVYTIYIQWNHFFIRQSIKILIILSYNLKPKAKNKVRPQSNKINHNTAMTSIM